MRLKIGYLHQKFPCIPNTHLVIEYELSEFGCGPLNVLSVNGNINTSICMVAYNSMSPKCWENAKKEALLKFKKGG